MKKLILFTLFATTLSLLAQSPKAQTETRPAFKTVPPPIYSAPPRPTSSETYVYDQKPLPGQPALVSPEQAQAIIGKFKEAYGKLNQPRLLIYVNRELVDEKNGMKIIAHTEKTESSRRRINSTTDSTGRASGPVTITAGRDVTVNGSDLDAGKGKISSSTENVSNENRYRLQERDSKLADRQTVRDVERLFGRPLRAGGASLADQGVATQLIADRQIRSFVVTTEGDAARKDREALSKITDVVVEVLISSRNIAVAEVSGETTHTVPDIQTTAIRLQDSKIIGQASSRDVLGKDRYAGRIARNFDVQDIAEATALALMEDIATGVK